MEATDAIKVMRTARAFVRLKLGLGDEGNMNEQKAAQGFIATIQELIDVGRELVAKEGL